MKDFENLGLAPILLENLRRLGMTSPTPIQAHAIPSVVAGRDLLGLAQTGTGKTAAFGLPMLTRIIAQNRRPEARQIRALVLAPTRELANQISESLNAYAEGAPVRVFRVVGGASINVQAQRLQRGVDVLIATPGRLIDLMDRRAIDLSQTGYLVLDEADQMLDIGFIHALRRIARALPQEDRQTLMFSATMPKLMNDLCAEYLTDPVRVEVAPPGRAAERIDQGVHFVSQGDKAALLAEYLSAHTDEKAVVFGRTKHGADKLGKLLDRWGFSVASIHGNKSQGQRERALAAFRDGEVKVLVATDVAARGLDIPLVEHVYNYDLPNVPENYVHRIGRTARAGRSGRAVAFCAPAEVVDLRAIEAAMKSRIPVIGGEAPSAEVAAAATAALRQSRRNAQQARSGGGPRPAKAATPSGQKPAKPKAAKPARSAANAGNGGGEARPSRKRRGGAARG
ncbi:DEAD/DEAH box helicase [Phaeovulum vinaykumarii]|uniref:DEAD/DEAH box helicase n=1 Tax=Phaeovulum vinaykumarii TaxID=407234 RepID=UPI0009702B88